jgi:hypothetical protein
LDVVETAYVSSAEIAYGIANTETLVGMESAFPTAFDARIEREYTFAMSGI